jgi:hypothetical protein
MAKKVVCGAAPSNAIATIRAAQQADGGWNFIGDPTRSGTDPDEIGLALMALAAGGVSGIDSSVQAALALLASSQQASGAWIDFFGTEGNASSTALAMLGITAAGYDATSACWRDTVAPGKAGTAYGNPAAWIRSQQQPDGHIASPYDIFGVNTLTTSQSVQGLLRSWLPIAPGASQTCVAPPPVVPTTTPTAGQSITITGDGFAPNTALVVELHSTAVVLAHTTTDGAGHYSVVVTIPLDAAPGAHEIVVSGLDVDGEVRTSSIAITGYQYDLKGQLRPVPREFHNDRYLPPLPFLIEDSEGNQLCTLQFLPWQDGGVILLKGKPLLTPFLLFLGKEALQRGGVVTRPEGEISYVLPIGEAGFRRMLDGIQKQSNMKVGADPSSLVLQKWMDEGTTTPLIARLYVGIFRLRDVVFPNYGERGLFDKAYEQILEALSSVRSASRRGSGGCAAGAPAGGPSSRRRPGPARRRRAPRPRRR